MLRTDLVARTFITELWIRFATNQRNLLTGLIYLS